MTFMLYLYTHHTYPGAFTFNMAGIQCGSFGLTTNVEGNKSYIHVKLTDSAFKAIDEYIKSRDKTIGKPSVFFMEMKENCLFLNVAMATPSSTLLCKRQFNKVVMSLLNRLVPTILSHWVQ